MTISHRRKRAKSQVEARQPEKPEEIDWSTDVEGKLEKLEPFIEAMADLLYKDLLRNPPQ